MHVPVRSIAGVRYFLLTALSLAPSFMFLFAALFEPSLTQLGLSQREASEIGDVIRIGSVLLVFGMIAYFAIYLHRLDDPKFDKEKKSLWTWILLLGNVIAVPVAWYRFVWLPR